jgi:hypothetical protein
MNYLVLILLIVISHSLFSKVDLKNFVAKNEMYYIRLLTGDELIGEIKDVVNNDDGDGVKVKTEIGTATIYDFQIAEIIPYSDYYKNGNRVYFLPTADPIKGMYLSNYQLIYMNFGVGVADIASITLGRTLLPASNTENITNLNLKATLLNEKFDSYDGYMTMAAGLNYAATTQGNYFLHAYGATTFRGERSALTLNVFYKAGATDITPIRLFDNTLFANYPNGSFGLGIGLDSRFKNSKDIHFIGELWNIDISRPTNTAVLLGIRMANTRFTADFGFAVFTQPAILPFTQFTWNIF